MEHCVPGGWAALGSRAGEQMAGGGGHAPRGPRGEGGGLPGLGMRGGLGQRDARDEPVPALPEHRPPLRRLRRRRKQNTPRRARGH